MFSSIPFDILGYSIDHTWFSFASQHDMGVRFFFFFFGLFVLSSVFKIGNKIIAKARTETAETDIALLVVTNEVH